MRRGTSPPRGRRPGPTIARGYACTEGDQLPVRRTLLRLMGEGLDRHEAIHAIGSVLAGHLNDLLRSRDTLASPEESNAAYFDELERLTAEDWLNSG